MALGKRLIDTSVAPSGQYNLDPSAYSYNSSASDNIAHGQYGGQWALSFNNDGSKLFWAYTYYNYHLNKSYSLSTNWDVTTRTEISSVSLNPSNNYQNVIDWKPDGTKFWQTGYTNGASTGSRDIYEFTPSTPWDFSVSSFSTYTRPDDLGHGRLLDFHGDGSKYNYLTGNDAGTSQRLREVTLGSNWTLASGQTTTYDVDVKSVFSELNTTGYSANVARWSPDGTTYYVVISYYNGSSHQGEVVAYNASVPYDIRTLSRRSTSTDLILNQANSPSGLWFSDDGSKLFVSYYITNYQGRIERYDL